MPRRLIGAALGLLMAVGLGLGAAAPASAITNFSGSRLYVDQTFSAYVGAGETLDVRFTRTAGSTLPVTFTVLDPAGATALNCVHPGGTANGSVCGALDLSSATAGVWTISMDTQNGAAHYSYDIVVRNSADAVITGRIWTTRYEQDQSGAVTQSYWVATREGYLYGLQLINYGGVGSAIRSNGFGLVEEGTCTPIYRSAEGTAINANGVPLEGGVEYSTTCGDDYLLFFEQPASDLPASAPSAAGEVWVRPALIAPSATNLNFSAADPFSRAGDITFDLAGVNGGYTVQIDTNADGDYTDPTDRIIPWGSPPGAVSVPFDGLDGLGQPVAACQAMNARVVVDRVGETHFVLEDVEQLGNAAATAAGIRLTGLTSGIVAPAPLLYWDDTTLAPRNPAEPFDGTDGTAGFDTTTLPAGDGAHGWRSGWGDTRSIENWTYYQASAGDEVAVEAPCDPSMTIDKDAALDDTNGNGRADVGESIDYSFLVSNTGNAPITDVTVTDPHVTGIAPATADLAVGADQLFTADPYVVTQADVDAGSIQNTAFATGLDPFGGEVETPTDSTLVLTPDRAPQLSIDKSAALNEEVAVDGLAELGETIDYTFTVTNTGNVTLTGVTVNDSRVTGITPASVDLVPGAFAIFTADPYAVSQADMNTGSITNTASASGTGPTGPVVSRPDSTVTPTPTPAPLLELDKSGVMLVDADGDGSLTPGDTVAYTFEVSNTGTVDLTDVFVTDPRLAGPTTPATADIGANGSAIYTGQYVVVQADLDSGELRNTAFATGTYEPSGGGDDVVVDSAPDTFVFPMEREPDLVVAKTGLLDDTNGNGFADVGETIEYSFEVTNTGNTTLVGVEVLDPRVTGLAPLANPLAPTESDVITANPYTVTQADVDAGGVTNVAVARGNVPGGPEVTTPPDEEFIASAPASPGITLEKSATLDDANGNGVADAGESVVFAFALLNTGNVTLYDVEVVDDMLLGLLPEPLDVLAPGIPVSVAADAYTVTPADVAAGTIVNTAHSRGALVDGVTAVESEDDSVVLVSRVSAGPAPQLGATGSDPSGLLRTGLLTVLTGTVAVAAAGFRRRRAA